MPRKPRGPATAHTVLVVDDQEETLVSVRRLVEREGHTVLTAENGERALELLKSNDVHLLLVDYFMPRMTGEQLVREVRTFDPDVQIILQTGYSGEKPPRTMLRELDIQGYHDKGDGPEQLLLWVDVALKAYRLMHGLCERQRLQAELVSNVSHEFRAPLGIISGYAQLLLGDGFGQLPSESKTPIGAIDKAVTSLDHLVSDLLSYAKLEAKTLSVVPKAIPVQELAAELEQFAVTLVDGRPLQFRLDLRDQVNVVYTDPSKLRAILRNLVTNAMKFTPSGWVTLRVESEATSVRFSVEDTGPGIAPDAQAVIFEPFRQLDGSMTRNHGGIGLGLALSRNLAHLLGGQLQVRSGPGIGATFTLVLPISCAAAAPETDSRRSCARAVLTDQAVAA